MPQPFLSRDVRRQGLVAPLSTCPRLHTGSQKLGEALLMSLLKERFCSLVPGLLRQDPADIDSVLREFSFTLMIRIPHHHGFEVGLWVLYRNEGLELRSFVRIGAVCGYPCTRQRSDDNLGLSLTFQLVVDKSLTAYLC